MTGVPPQESADEVEAAFVTFAETIVAVQRLPRAKQAEVAARLYRGLKYLTDQVQELRNAAIYDLAVALATHNRDAYNESMSDLPNIEPYEGEWEAPDDFDTYPVGRQFEQFCKLDLWVRLGALRIVIAAPDGLPGVHGGRVMLDAFSSEREPFTIADRIRRRRVSNGILRREREARRRGLPAPTTNG